MTNFDEATAVMPVGGSSFRTRLFPEWAVGGKPHGGYLMASLARAAGLAVLAAGGAGSSTGPAGSTADPDRSTDAPDVTARLPHPLAASAHFLSPPEIGPGEITTKVLRIGRRMSQVRATLVQEGTERAEALFTLGPLAADTEPAWADVPPVDVPGFSECVAIAAAQPKIVSTVRILKVAEVRLDPASAGFLAGRPTGYAELRGWLRFLDGREADPLSLLFAVDAFPPATFEIGSEGWVPTLELTTYVRALPAAGPLRVRQRARLVEAGLVDESCDVWDSRGRLVAQATQLAGVRLATDAESFADPGRRVA